MGESMNELGNAKCKGVYPIPVLYQVRLDLDADYHTVALCKRFSRGPSSDITRGGGSFAEDPKSIISGESRTIHSSVQNFPLHETLHLGLPWGDLAAKICPMDK